MLFTGKKAGLTLSVASMAMFLAGAGFAHAGPGGDGHAGITKTCTGSTCTLTNTAGKTATITKTSVTNADGSVTKSVTGTGFNGQAISKTATISTVTNANGSTTRTVTGTGSQGVTFTKTITAPAGVTLPTRGGKH